MPRKDPVARAKYNRERNERINADPDLLAKKNADSRAQFKLRMEDPEYRDRRTASAKKARDKAGVEGNRKIQRRAQLKKYYGLTEEEYAATSKKQRGVCAICKQHNTRKKDGRRFDLSVDHCHETGKVRGLLCSECNLGIGKFKHDPSLLHAAIEYLSG